MSVGRFMLASVAVAASTPVHGQVYQVGSDGVMTEITNQEWKASPTVETVAPKAPPAERVSINATPNPYREEIDRAAAHAGLSSALVDAVAWTESRYRANARSRTGAIGVMQLMPGTARELGVGDASDPARNIKAGALYLRAQLDRFNDVERALAAYNAGPGAVIRHRGVPPYRETQRYVRTIMERLAATAIADSN